MYPPSRRRSLRIAAAVGAAAVLGGVAGAIGYDLGDDDVTPTPTVSAAPVVASSRTDQLTVGEIYRRASPAVVVVKTSAGGDDSGFGRSPSQQGQGSGFVIDEEGRIVTNHHVIDGADSITVTFADGSTHDAELVGSDASTDLAVLDVDVSADELEPLALGDSKALTVGDPVVAMGSPYGLEQTVTAGIVSALGRDISAPPNGFAIGDAIQTDAAINRGNSGGPLLNMRGQVIGVNSQIDSASGGNDGVGFAVSSATVRTVAAQLIDDGAVAHAYLGVSVQTIPADAAEELGTVAGAAVTGLRSGGAADDAGLNASTDTRTLRGTAYPTGGDVITALDGNTVSSSEDLRRLVDGHQPGDEVELTVAREGGSEQVTVSLAERPASP